ncbi:dynein regulatory complex subunit 4-like [Astyanax mexicanus]|uniref:dynein regulatory complex subunit 4-like n=1 Tax=Astyanax mexicanus TaxID=7994 RepID=UPI0020CB0887|nr:dynein regulatory complex subunit 4-like [Astyanax mexicanus]
MAPKKKGKKTVKDIKPAASTEVSKEELEAQIVSLRKELDREKKQCTYFQLERDKIHSFWEISKEQLYDVKRELSKKCEEIEQAEESHNLEIRAYKQKVKHLLYEHQLSITELREEGEVSNKLLQKEYEALKGDLQKDVKNLKVKLKEEELSYKSLIRNLKLNHSKEMTDIRTYFEQLLQDMEAKYKTKMEALSQQADIRRTTEIEMMEKRKNSQIRELIQDQEKTQTDIKAYYKDIVSSSLARIKALKEGERDMKEMVQKLKSEVAKVLREKKQLTEPLRIVSEEASVLRKQVTDHSADKHLLEKVRARLKVAEKEICDRKFEISLLEEKISTVQQERDGLYQGFQKAIQEVKQKKGIKSIVKKKKTLLKEDLGRLQTEG